MARKKKTRKKARTANRLDYTKGGRVGYQVGGPKGGGRGEPTEEEIQRNIEDRQDGGTGSSMSNQTTNTGQDSNEDSQSETAISSSEQARQDAQNIIDTKGSQAPQAEVKSLTEGEKQLGDLPTGTGQLTTPPPSVTAQEATTDAIAPEQVTQITDVAQVDAPTPMTAAQVDAATIAPVEKVEAAEGIVSEESLAKAAGVDRIDPIEAATVGIVPGALTERVVGVLSPEAKAQAAEVAGTDLSRVTRAKKQLRNAGISESVITELGNNPEALEDALMDLTEEERGVIEGLPKEALVSNQMDTLLKGIEEGEIPTWARPAVDAVESMLASRGLSASSVGRDALFNAIIQSAIPLAQSNAQAIQAAVSRDRTIEAQVAIKEAEFQQQSALSNAQRVFQFDLAQFSADQQTALSNSKFLQSVSLAEAQFNQQAAVQNAILMSQANLAEADLNQRAQIQNAQAFLQMDMANLTNEQQTLVLKAQQDQQILLSNQAAQNAAAQFNATSQNQVNQFMASLNAQVNQYNATQMNAVKQFNAAASNAAEARRVNNEVELEKVNAQLRQDAEKFNAQAQFEQDQFNARNALLVEQSNIEWRRQVNLAETAAINEANRINAQNQFQLTSQAQAFIWQDLRDKADFDFRAAENERDREAQIVSTAIGADPGKYARTKDSLIALAGELFS